MKNAEAIEKMNKVDTLIVDKTGTITQGTHPMKKSVSFSAQFDKNEILQFINALNQNSEHPSAETIVQYGKEKGISDITLVKGDLSGIAKAKNLSTRVMKNIKQNLFFALGYNTLGIPIAAGILFPFFGILLSPMIAALAMSFSSVSVIGNALRLRNVRI